MWLQITILACLLIFFVALIWRTIRYARMPVHLRWELYPVAHEKNRPYGGSYLEEAEWWHRPIHRNQFGEFNTFISEILLFKEYFKNKRNFWYFVYPFHLGLFLVIVWIVFLIIGAVISSNGITITANSTNIVIQIIYYLTLICGVVAFALGIFGTIGLLIKRAVNEDLKNYTDPIDYFNLACILVIFLAGMLMWIFEDSTFSMTRSYIQNLFLIQPTPARPILIIFLLISSLFLAYMPFTRMVHYVAKYFTYHKVRWDDQRSMKGSKMESEIGELLSQPENWSASHVKQGGTWTEQAAGTGLPDKTDVK